MAAAQLLLLLLVAGQLEEEAEDGLQVALAYLLWPDVLHRHTLEIMSCYDVILKLTMQNKLSIIRKLNKLCVCTFRQNILDKNLPFLKNWLKIGRNLTGF